MECFFRLFITMSRESLIEGDYMMAATNSPAIPGMETHLIDGKADISITLSTMGEAKGKVAQMLHATTATW